MRSVIYLMIIPLMIFQTIEVAASEVEPVLISTYEEDLTGDGKLDIIKLYGVHFSPDSEYYKDIFAIITSGSEEWRIDYQGGYDPAIQFIDLNHDNVPDIFYQSPTGGSGGLYTSKLDTLARGELESIPLPEQDYIKGYFEDGFQAVIELGHNAQPILLDVADRKDDYIRLGIFDASGKLLQETSLMFDPIAFFEPVEISSRNGYGLKSFKQISGAYHADQLGVVETLWYYEDGKWVALQVDWKGASEYDAAKFY